MDRECSLNFSVVSLLHGYVFGTRILMQKHEIAAEQGTILPPLLFNKHVLFTA